MNATTERRNYRSNTLQSIALAGISAIAASGDGLVGILAIALIVIVTAAVEVIAPRYRKDDNTHTRTHNTLSY